MVQRELSNCPKTLTKNEMKYYTKCIAKMNEEDYDIFLEPRSMIGKRAKRTLRKKQQIFDEDECTITFAPQMSKEKQKSQADYLERRYKYEVLSTVHWVLNTLPQDIVYIIQTKAGMIPEAMPIPKIIR